MNNKSKQTPPLSQEIEVKEVLLPGKQKPDSYLKRSLLQLDSKPKTLMDLCWIMTDDEFSLISKHAREIDKITIGWTYDEKNECHLIYVKILAVDGFIYASGTHCLLSLYVRYGDFVWKPRNILEALKIVEAIRLCEVESAAMERKIFSRQQKVSKSKKVKL